MISFEVRGDPSALKRHRQGKFTNYDPSAGDKADFLSIAHANAPDIPFECPLHLDVTFYMSRPKSHFGTGKNATKLKPSAPNFKVSRPDIDNYLKFVMDALNKVFWHDDSYVVSVKMVKRYDLVPRVKVVIRELT